MFYIYEKKLSLLIILLIFSTAPFTLVADDYSTPKNGNLTTKTNKRYAPNQVISYEDYSILDKHNISFKYNRIYRLSDDPKTVNIKSRTINSDIVWIDDDTYVILTGNSESYPHGILGDNIESTGFQIYRNHKLIVEYKLPKERVFETLRPLIADIITDHSGVEIILTSSDINNGSRVDIFSLNGELLTSSEPIGRGFRWLHILGVMTLNKSKKPYLSIVKTPHIGGVLELLSWNGKKLITDTSLKNVSTHKIGSDNLNMALLLSHKDNKDSLIIVPAMDYRTLLFIIFKESGLEVIKKVELPGILSTNLFFDHSEKPSIWLGLTNGKIVQVK